MNKFAQALLAMGAAAAGSLAIAAPPSQLTEAEMARVVAGVPAFLPASPGDHFAGGFQLSNSQKGAIVLLPGTYGTSSEATLYETHRRADASANAAAQARSATFTFLGFP